MQGIFKKRVRKKIIEEPDWLWTDTIVGIGDESLLWLHVLASWALFQIFLACIFDLVWTQYIFSSFFTTFVFDSIVFLIIWRSPFWSNVQMFNLCWALLSCLGSIHYNLSKTRSACSQSYASPHYFSAGYMHPSIHFQSISRLSVRWSCEGN